MTGVEIRSYQREQIREFITAQDYEDCRVLDYGCGIAPYRSIVEDGGGRWTGYNRAVYPGGAKVDIGPSNVLAQRWDVILCTQMLQYVRDPRRLIQEFRPATRRLVLTYATNWPEVEPEDLFRFTHSGMETMLGAWTIETHEMLGELSFGDSEILPLGYGVVARPNELHQPQHPAAGRTDTAWRTAHRVITSRTDTIEACSAALSRPGVCR